MFHRIVPAAIAAASLALLLFAFGCGSVHESFVPQVGVAGTATAIDRAELARLDAADAVAEAEGEGDDAWREHATPINSATTITSPGDYRLVADLDVSDGDGIVVRSDHVRLWLGDHWLRGPGNKVGRAIVLDQVRDVSAYGGHIEHFGFGAVVLGSSDCRLLGIDVRGADEFADPPNGIPPQIGIMLIDSARNRIGGNRLTDVNLGIFVRGSGSHENAIRGNQVVAKDHGLLGICYNPAPGASPAGPQHDRVSRNRLARFGTGISASAQSVENYFTANAIDYFDAAYKDLNGTNVFERNVTRQIIR